MAFRGTFIELFSDVRPEFMHRKMTIFRWAKRAVEEARDTGLPVLANLDPEIGSSALLSRLGFIQHNFYWRLHG